MLRPSHSLYHADNHSVVIGPPLAVTHLITGLRTGGAEMMLTKLVESMDRTRIKSHVISLTDEGDLGERISRAGIPVHTLGMNRSLDLPVAAFRLSSLLKQCPPTILSTWLYHADFVGTIVAKSIRIPRLVWTIRTADMDLRRYSPTTTIIRAALAQMSSMPNLVITNSISGRVFHEDIGYRPQQWALLPNGFDVERFQPDRLRRKQFRELLGVDENTTLIGLPARFDPAKDHESFIRAAALLSKECRDVRFVLAGRDVDPQNVELARLIAEHRVADRIHLLGHRDDMEFVLGGLDIVTLCSAFGEAFPNVIGEAMASGVLCVVTNVGDAARIVEEDGAVVPRKNPKALCDAWQRMIALPEQQKHDMRIRARERIINQYSLKSISRQYESLLETMI